MMSGNNDVEIQQQTVQEDKRTSGSAHIGDTGLNLEDVENLGDATWGEVFEYCCVRSPLEWVYVFIGFLGVVFCLYFFMFGLDVLSSSAKVIGGCTAGSLFGDDTNPIAGLMVGILSTALLQSSSTTTSIVVSLVGSAVSTRQGIYMVMGANIGTTVTNTIVSLGQLGDGDQFERAFAGATVHDMFNFLSVAVLLPVEVISGYLYYLTKAMVQNADTEKGDKWEGPIKKLVHPLGKKIIMSNKKIIKGVAEGDNTCNDFYPTYCKDGVVSAKTCKTGLIDCDKTTGDCPAFFMDGATRKDDEVSGGVCMFVGLCILLVSLIGIVTILQKMLLGASTRIIYKATNINGYLGMAIGAGVTMVVQSSSVFTSTLTPLVGVGVLRIEQMFPMTLGANVGTTLTAIMAALVTEGTDALQVALAHLSFNVSGILIWYPIPFMRRIPIGAALRLGKATRMWRGIPVIYIIVMFFVVPLIFLGLSSLFEQEGKGFVVLGSFITVILAIGLLYTAYWCRFKGGQEKCTACMQRRQKRRTTLQSLPEDMDFLKEKVYALMDHTGLDDDGECNDPEQQVKVDGDKSTDSDDDIAGDVEVDA